MSFEKRMFFYYVSQMVHERLTNRIVCFTFNHRWEILYLIILIDKRLEMITVL